MCGCIGFGNGVLNMRSIGGVGSWSMCGRVGWGEELCVGARGVRNLDFECGKLGVGWVGGVRREE